MFHLYNIFLNLSNICSIFSSGIIILSTALCFSILLLFNVVIASVILFPKNSPGLWTKCLEAFGPVSNNCVLYFFANNKNSYPLTYFLVLGSVKYCVSSIY